MTNKRVQELMQEYFRLKDEDKSIRQERNAYLNTLTGWGKSDPCMSPLYNEEGPCFRQQRGMGGYPPELCESCSKRNGWYLRRQKLSQRRSAIMRRVRRLVATPPKEDK